MAEAGPQDAVLLTLKAHQVDLLPDLRALFGPQTGGDAINGIPWWYFHKLAGEYEGRRLIKRDPGGVIAAHIERESVIGSVVHPATELVAPGVEASSKANRFTWRADGERSERIDAHRRR